MILLHCQTHWDLLYNFFTLQIPLKEGIGCDRRPKDRVKRGWLYYCTINIYIYIKGPTYTVPSMEYGLWHESISFSSSFSALGVLSLSSKVIKFVDLRLTSHSNVFSDPVGRNKSLTPQPTFMYVCMYVCIYLFIYYLILLFFKILVWSFHMWHWGYPIFFWGYF